MQVGVVGHDKRVDQSDSLMGEGARGERGREVMSRAVT